MRRRFRKVWFRRARRLVKGVGAGLVAGASDNDPTSVATLSVVGSTTVYGLSWLVVLILPMLLVVQVISARLGVISRRSLQQVIGVRFGRPWALVSMGLVVAVDVVTVGADLEGGGAALSLLLGGDWRLYLLPLAAASAALLMMGRYDDVQRFLRLVLLVFVGYIAAGFLAHPDWRDVLLHTFIPTFQLTPAYVAGALALLGTTLTSYVYFWETIEEEEERPPRGRLGVVELDAALGIVFASVIFWFILISSAATSGVSGSPVTTAQDAATALAPLAGRYAQLLFALGLLASALLALPVLAATTGYVVVQAFGGRPSVEEPVKRETLPFYAVILLTLAAGVALSFLGIDPIRLLFLAGIAGGIGTPPLLIMLLLAAGDRRVMGRHRVRGVLKAAGWFSAAVVSAASVVYLVYHMLGLGG